MRPSASDIGRERGATEAIFAPIRNIVYSATAEDLDTVLIDGEVRIRGREIPGVDINARTRDLQAAGERMWANVHKGDWAGRSVDELAPQSFPAWRG